MDRTDELVRAFQLFKSIDHSRTAGAAEPSPFLVRSNRVSADLDQNGKLVQKMHTLTERKEFSNDPIHEMKKISTVFQTNVTNIEADIARLKKEADIAGQGNSVVQHRKLILEYLDKLLRKHVGSFKDAVKVYSGNVEQRNKRVGNKYGQVAGIGSLTSTSENASKYAMFSATIPEPPAVYSSTGAGSELRNRRGGGGGATHSAEASSAYTAVGDDFTEEVTFSQPPSSSGSANAGNSGGVLTAEDAYENDKKYGKGGRAPPPASGAASYGGASSNLRGSAAPAPSSGVGTGSAASGTGAFARNRGTAGRGGDGGGAQQQQQQVMQKGRGRELDRHRLQQAEQAESTIAQMGQLFAQMATLVSEQSEVITRIEDDVEAGLQDTLEAQGHLQSVYEITKGNRGLILKIFALLVVFIFLFLVWT